MIPKGQHAHCPIFAHIATDPLHCTPYYSTLAKGIVATMVSPCRAITELSPGIKHVATVFAILKIYRPNFFMQNFL